HDLSGTGWQQSGLTMATLQLSTITWCGTPPKARKALTWKPGQVYWSCLKISSACMYRLWQSTTEM
ncbi:MAG: hypothetical protein LBR22_06775, partial [Desulfovibrio sp.]|nr:hypothetical protein [Desulfovibrio sp.]